MTPSVQRISAPLWFSLFLFSACAEEQNNRSLSQGEHPAEEALGVSDSRPGSQSVPTGVPPADFNQMGYVALSYNLTQVKVHHLIGTSSGWTSRAINSFNTNTGGAKSTIADIVYPPASAKDIRILFGRDNLGSQTAQMMIAASNSKGQSYGANMIRSQNPLLPDSALNTIIDNNALDAIPFGGSYYSLWRRTEVRNGTSKIAIVGRFGDSGPHEMVTDFGSSSIEAMAASAGNNAIQVAYTSSQNGIFQIAVTERTTQSGTTQWAHKDILTHDGCSNFRLYGFEIDSGLMRHILYNCQKNGVFKVYYLSGSLTTWDQVPQEIYTGNDRGYLTVDAAKVVHILRVTPGTGVTYYTNTLPGYIIKSGEPIPNSSDVVSVTRPQMSSATQLHFGALRESSGISKLLTFSRSSSGWANQLAATFPSGEKVILGLRIRQTPTGSIYVPGR